jgi:hypothetical protein
MHQVSVDISRDRCQVSLLRNLSSEKHIIWPIVLKLNIFLCFDTNIWLKSIKKVVEKNKTFQNFWIFNDFLIEFSKYFMSRPTKIGQPSL